VFGSLVTQKESDRDHALSMERAVTFSVVEGCIKIGLIILICKEFNLPPRHQKTNSLWSSKERKSAQRVENGIVIHENLYFVIHFFVKVKLPYQRFHHNFNVVFIVDICLSDIISADISDSQFEKYTFNKVLNFFLGFTSCI